MNKTAKLLLAPVLLGLIATAASGEGVTIRPSEVGMGLTFHGTTMHLEAPVRPGETAVFLVVGPERDLHLKVKGRRGGILWMSVGEVEFSAVPALYLVAAAPALPAPEVLEKAGLVPEVLSRELLTKSASKGKRDAFSEMLKLFEKERLFGSVRGVGRVRDGTAIVDFPLPPRATEGVYQVRVTYFGRGGARMGPEGEFTVRKTGVIERATRLATEHGFAYGMAAVVIAILAGLFTGFIFGRGGAH